MDSWFMIEVTFTGNKPSPTEVIRLNRALKSIDCNAPDVSKKGIWLSPWRNPVKSLDTLLAFFTHAGFDCVGRQYKDCDSIFLDHGSIFVKTNEYVGKFVVLSASDLKVWDEAYWESENQQA